MRKYWNVGLATLAAAGLSGVTGAASATTTRAVATPPAAVCVPGVGCSPWRRADAWSRTPSVYTTSFHPVAAQPSVTAYAAWMRTSSTQLALYPGYKGPGDTPFNRGPEEVPPTARGRLLATFNSGFYEFDRAGGFYVHGTLYFPMVRGLATVVRYASGRVDLQTWRWGARPGKSVVMARQNLPLLVADGAPTPLSADNAAWGVTLHGVPDVWRTALGIDAAGNLVYAAAPAQTSASLARIMVQLHCVRAMQLDINPEWPIFVTYGGPGAQNPSLFVPNPNQIPGRFLYPSTKDFFALYAVSSPGGEQPW